MVLALVEPADLVRWVVAAHLVPPVVIQVLVLVPAGRIPRIQWEAEPQVEWAAAPECPARVASAALVDPNKLPRLTFRSIASAYRSDDS